MTCVDAPQLQAVHRCPGFDTISATLKVRGLSN